ncbi:50S ribosomal protein L19 [Candidatus Saccharibacteria bacterium]|nr:50S ribosomal protein L19 [Candidatus Saccharibacteria bacterium]
MDSVIHKIEQKYKKSQVVDVRPGDTVKVHQKIKEGSKERIQIFQGMVIRVDKKNSLSSRIVVRRISSGVGVEKSFLMHSPLVVKVEVTKRSKVRRNYLTYMRERTGKSARLSNVDFDREGVNAVQDEAAEAEEAKMHEEAKKAHAAEEAKKAEAEAKESAKVEEMLANRENSTSEDKLDKGEKSEQ